MIGFFVKAGDIQVSQKFDPYRKKFEGIIEKTINNKKYGEGLDLILIEYHLEGKFLEIPDYQYKVCNFRKKERAISVKVYVPSSFELLSGLEKKEFIIKTTEESVILVKKKMAKSDISNFNFDSLLLDLKQCSVTYMQIVTID